MRDGKLNTYFPFFWLLGWWTWVQNPWSFQMPQILKNRCNFTLRWVLNLGNTSLEQHLRLKTLVICSFFQLFFFICCFSNCWLLSKKQPQSSNVNHCIWVIGFWHTAEIGGFGSLHLTEFPVSFDHNDIRPPLIHLLKKVLIFIWFML